LASGSDEGRGKLRKVSGSSTHTDPGMSEWGNLPIYRYAFMNT